MKYSGEYGAEEAAQAKRRSARANEWNGVSAGLIMKTDKAYSGVQRGEEPCETERIVARANEWNDVSAGLKKRLPVTFRQAGGPNHIYLAPYKDWLDKQSITPSTTRAYYSRIKQFLIFLEYTNTSDTPLNDLPGVNKAMRQYLDFLKQSQKGNTTINANINALKNFSQFLGIGEVELKRERCYDKSTKLLTSEEQKRFLQVVEIHASVRDKALALVLFYTGLRIGDCARLNTENIGAGAASISLNATTKIFLNQQTMLALRQWLQERQKLPNVLVESGLWLTKQGQRLQTAGIAGVIERLGWQAKLVVSVETIRRTWLTKTNEELNKNELVSKFGGYISKSTIKRYGGTFSIDPTLPVAAHQ